MNVQFSMELDGDAAEFQALFHRLQAIGDLPNLFTELKEYLMAESARYQQAYANLQTTILEGFQAIHDQADHEKAQVLAAIEAAKNDPTALDAAAEAMEAFTESLHQKVDDVKAAIDNTVADGPPVPVPTPEEQPPAANTFMNPRE